MSQISSTLRDLRANSFISDVGERPGGHCASLFRAAFMRHERPATALYAKNFFIEDDCQGEIISGKCTAASRLHW